MATIKSYTDLDQSKKLAEILPLESADWTILNCFNEFGKKDGSNIRVIKEVNTLNDSVEKIPCWSLAALLDIIPTMIGSIFEKDALRLRIDKSGTDFNIWYDNLDTGMVEEGFDIIKTNPVDACYEMILKLHELNLL